MLYYVLWVFFIMHYIIAIFGVKGQRVSIELELAQAQATRCFISILQVYKYKHCSST